jgi:hypothetical protein
LRDQGEAEEGEKKAEKKRDADKILYCKTKEKKEEKEKDSR